MRRTQTILAILVILAAAAAQSMADDGNSSAPPLAQPAFRAAVNDDAGPAPIPEPAAFPERVAQPLPPAPMPHATAVPPATGAAPVASDGANESSHAGSAVPCSPRCCRNGCGCRECDDSERPFGACVRAATCAQICNGIKARMVLYQYDFCDASACDGYKLSPKGVARLTDIARMLPTTNFHPITIEASLQNAQLDAARRAYVLRTLSHLNLPVPEQLVVVGTPQTPGLNGTEALILHANLLRDTKAGGSQLSPVNSAAGGSGGMTSGYSGNSSGGGGSNQSQ